jgi:N-acetylglucosamine kinase-like BadF-type ATPase
MKKWVIGLDGGGTKTVGVLVDEAGCVAGRAVAESSNYQVIGGEKLGQVISGLVKELMASYSAAGAKATHLYAGLAGAGRPADREAIQLALRQHDLAETISVDTDASAALAGAFAGGPGIIVISGTGAICFGKSKDHVVYRCGGWGYLLGDEGSGYYIGQQALIASLKDLDGRGQKTLLRPAIEEKYQVGSIDLLISAIYSGKMDRTEIAGLAPMVFDIYAKGDQAAVAIIESAGKEIGKIVAAVSKRMGMQDQPVTVALIGSIFKQRHILLPFMEQEARRTAATVTFIDPQFEPAIGSAVLALQKENIAIDAKVMANLQKTAGN